MVGTYMRFRYCETAVENTVLSSLTCNDDIEQLNQ
jgi:hypothetical protein